MSSPGGWYSSPTQVYCACCALLEGRTNDHRTEFREVRGWRLAASCHRLKSRYGRRILCDLHRTALRFPPSARALAAEGEA